ncbi:MAG: glycosyltransferase family 4 protein [Methanophagales archaeon]|nr:glycosyltransferase family 4 protein [Methanophagales archaeon]
MKIAIYHRDISGGIKTHVESLSREFEKQGHEVKRIDQFSLGSYMLGNTKGGISYGLDFALSKIKEKVADCDILHIHHAATVSELFLPFSSICSDISIVNTFHTQTGEGLKGEVARTYISLIVTLYTGRSKKFISVSAENAEYLRQHCYVDNIYDYETGAGNSNSKSIKTGTELVVIPNGVDVNRFYPADKDTDTDMDKNGEERDDRKKPVCIGYLGRLSPEKNVIGMIKAVKALKQAEINLKIAGTGPLFAKLKKLEDERIKILGYVEDAASFYRSVDVFLLPSKLEAQPITLLEAMASGLPIIATDVGDNKHFISGNGILCGTSVKEIGAAIETMLSEKNGWVKMGIESRKIVEQNYTWDKIARRTLEVYRTALSS